MALQFSTTDQLGTAHGIKCLVYSRAGIGKTRLCATAPAPIIFAAEAGLLSLRRVSLPAAQIRSLADVHEAYRWITQSAEARQFATICLDSITEIAEVVLAAAKKGEKDPRRAYNTLLDEMIEAVRAFRDIPGKHVYMSAKLEPIVDGATGMISYGPSMPGRKLGPGLPYYFDEVFFLGTAKLQTGEEYRYLQTQPDMQHEAKDRSGVLDIYEPPDLNHVFQKIVGA